MEENNNSAAFIFGWNIMAHIGQPWVREQSIACHVLGSPEWFFKHDESFQGICSELIVKNDSFVFTDTGEVDISDDLEWNCTDNLFCKDFKRLISLFKTSNNNEVLKNIVNINGLWVQFSDLINMFLKISLNGLNEFSYDLISAFNKIGSLMLLCTQELFQDADIVRSSVFCQHFVHAVYICADALCVL